MTMNRKDYLKETSSVRFLGELGPNLIKVAEKLLANQKLLRLLMYTDKDPLNPNKPNISKKDVYKNGRDGNIRVIPKILDKTEDTSVLSLMVLKGVPSPENIEVLDIYISIEIFVPNNQWVIKGENLRPYAIMGEIQRSLEGEEINGLGTINGSGFSVHFFSEEMSDFMMNYTITQFN